MTDLELELQRLLIKRNIPRMDYDIAKNSLKKVIKNNGQAGLIALAIVYQELIDLSQRLERLEK